jgi:hypothetical protein
MRDPFPIPPIASLQRLFEPFATFLGLETLPLHVHEIVWAFAFYHLVFVYVAPTLSFILVADRYRLLSMEGRLRWNMKCVSFVQSSLISLLSILIMNFDMERREMNLEERVWGYTGAAGMVQALAVGYFVWDTYIMARYTRIFGEAMLVHGISCTIAFSLGFVGTCSYFISLDH